ncbi:MAG: MFS transporter [Candidatus Bathyarchaeia archaeon]
MDKKTTLGLSSYQFMAMARRGLFYTFLSLYLVAGLGLSVTATTLLASLSMIANSVSQTFVWGKVSDKYRIRARLVVIGETTAALGYVLIYFLHIHLLNTTGSMAAAYSIIAGLTILEFFWSMSNLGWSALLSDVSTYKERGKLMSVVSSIGGVGRILGISVSGVLYDLGGEAGGFRNGVLFFFPSGIMLASALLIWFSTRSSEQNYRNGETGEAILEERTTQSHTYSSRAFYWFLASISIAGLGTYSILQILIFYVNLDSPIGATALDIAMISNSASIATIIFSLLAGPLANKIGRKNTLSVGLALTVITPVLYMFAQNAAQMIIINSLSGVSMALVSVVGYLLASDLIPAGRRGRLFGQYNAVTSVSFGIAGTIIGGPIADYMIGVGSTKAVAYVTTFQAASAISLMGTILFASKVKSKPP